MDTFELEIATPERLVMKGSVTEAQIPCLNGYIGVLPMHVALVSELGEGELTYKTAAGQPGSLHLKGGYVEVLANHVRVLTTQVDAPETRLD